MNDQPSITVTGLLVLILISAGGSMAVAQNQEKPSMAPVPVAGKCLVKEMVPTVKEKVSVRSFINHLALNKYEAAADGLSFCGDDKYCLEDAKKIRSWFCAARVCDGTDKSKRPVDCFKDASWISRISTKDQDQLGSSFCSLVGSPGPSTRESFESYLMGHNLTEASLVAHGAYVMALKGSAASCEEYIKGYVGVYGPQWDYNWYRRAAGCRILAHERTREQEEKDFYTWFGAVQGADKCSNIVDIEMRKACGTPGAASPFPDYVQ